MQIKALATAVSFAAALGFSGMAFAQAGNTMSSGNTMSAGNSMMIPADQMEAAKIRCATYANVATQGAIGVQEKGASQSSQNQPGAANQADQQTPSPAGNGNASGSAAKSANTVDTVLDVNTLTAEQCKAAGM